MSSNSRRLVAFGEAMLRYAPVASPIPLDEYVLAMGFAPFGVCEA